MSRDKKQLKSSDVKWYSPLNVTIIGVDTDDGPSHNLCDAISNATPLEEWKIVHAMEHGIEDPCIALRDGDRILIWKGRSRTRYLREANKRLEAEGRKPLLLPLIIKRGAHDGDGVLASRILENWLRRDLSIIDKAKEANMLIERGEMTEEQVCTALGIGIPRLKEMLKLLNLGARAQAAVASGKISASSAAPLARLSVEKQNEKLDLIEKEIEKGAKPTIHRVRAATGAAEVQTPKVRLSKAADALQAIAGDLAAMIGDDHPMMASLSVLCHAVTGKTWQEMTAPVAATETTEAEVMAS